MVGWLVNRSGLLDFSIFSLILSKKSCCSSHISSKKLAATGSEDNPATRSIIKHIPFILCQYAAILRDAAACCCKCCEMKPFYLDISARSPSSGSGELSAHEKDTPVHMSRVEESVPQLEDGVSLSLLKTFLFALLPSSSSIQQLHTPDSSR